MAEQCPCQSGLDYEGCCGPYHQGTPAPDAEKLMRSRYSAYAKGLADYIIQTTHRENPQYQKNMKRWRGILNDYMTNTGFQRLQVVDKVLGEQEATVTFIADLWDKGANEPLVLKEKSRFVKVGKRWLYHSAMVDFDR